MSTRKQIAIVLSGGIGSRFSERTPKQFIMMGDKPLLIHTLYKFSTSIDVDRIYVVAPKQYLEETKELIAKYHVKKVAYVLPGGPTREESTLHALDFIYKEGINFSSLIMVHDADRPNVTHKIIKDNFRMAYNTGTAVTAINPADSIAYSREGLILDAYLNRNLTYFIQTPQTFRFDILYSSIVSSFKKGTIYKMTDEASIVKANHYKIKIVEGDPNNFKITTRVDAAIFIAGLK